MLSVNINVFNKRRVQQTHNRLLSIFTLAIIVGVDDAATVFFPIQNALDDGNYLLLSFVRVRNRFKVIFECEYNTKRNGFLTRPGRFINEYKI